MINIDFSDSEVVKVLKDKISCSAVKVNEIESTVGDIKYRNGIMIELIPPKIEEELKECKGYRKYISGNMYLELQEVGTLNDYYDDEMFKLDSENDSYPIKDKIKDLHEIAVKLKEERDLAISGIEKCEEIVSWLKTGLNLQKEDIDKIANYLLVTESILKDK